MDATDKTFSEIVSLFKSWMPGRSEPANISRVFWMPDQSCRVCYECDSLFTIVNRRHHCRLCGRVFCTRCTANSIPAPSSYPRTSREDSEKIRVCNYCYKQWEQGLAILDNGFHVARQDVCGSPSTLSLASNISSGTVSSSSNSNSSSITLVSMPSIGTSQGVQENSNLSSQQSSITGKNMDWQDELASGRNNDIFAGIGDLSQRQYRFSMTRSEYEDDDDDGVYQSDNEARHSPQVNGYHGQVKLDGMRNEDGLYKVPPYGENIYAKSLSSSSLLYGFESQVLEGITYLEKKADENFIGDECEASSSLYASEDVNSEPVDFENNGLLWLPPEPEDEEDEREAFLFDDDDDDNEGDATGEWGYLRTSSFRSGEYRSRDRSAEEHKKAMKNVVDGHFRALVAQLLQVENLPVGEGNDKESWLEIITSLSWEAATLLKPDMSQGGGMDPGGYVKVKCIASGDRCNSTVVKGVVCKKNVAHRRMTSRIEKPRLLILGGALEYQRVSNHLSSFDTLLQQELDHLKMAVAKIDAQHPDVLLVEKSVSRYAQEYLLAKDISLVLNIKRSLLERVARCTGAQIVPSIDHLSSQKLGYCEKFHVERFLEDLDPASQGGRKMVKTLMYFEGCPKPLGCTVLLRGANRDELKKVKRVVQFGVFAAYHLALETSFLADEGASLPELPLNSPITVALPDKPSRVERSISMVPGFSIPGNERSRSFPASDEPRRSSLFPTSDLASSTSNIVPCLPNDPSSQPSQSTSCLINSAALLSCVPVSGIGASELYGYPCHSFEERNEIDPNEAVLTESATSNNSLTTMGNHLNVNGIENLDLSRQYVSDNVQNYHGAVITSQLGGSELSSLRPNSQNHNEEIGSSKEDPGPLKEDFPPSPSDHQSILVSLSSRCVWKGTVCERSHLFRIKYYGNFDKPLGRFLRDHLFDQSYRCHSCEMPSEAHVHCYTHRQGTLTISVKKLPEFLLPGERDGKIWMWHRCLRCPRTNGFPPATRRVVMSDAAWGLSFGKFLELSFSNHAAASRVASCGHSLHRDCLRFYGFGKMVACFRYASIDVHSVYLPPSKLDFISENQEWILKEKNEVVNQAELLFSEVLNALHQIGEKSSGAGQLNGGMKTPKSRRQIAELEGRLQKEKAEFWESLQKNLNRQAKKDQPAIDILDINRLRRQLLFQSYMWDHHLIYAASRENSSIQNRLNNSTSELEEKPLVKSEKFDEISMATKSLEGSDICDSFMDEKDSRDPDNGDLSGKTNQSDISNQEIEISQGPDPGKEDTIDLSSSISIYVQSEPLESGVNVSMSLPDGQYPIMASLSDTLDAAWTGENHPVIGVARVTSLALSESAVADLSTISTAVEGQHLDDHTEDRNGYKIAHSLSQPVPMKALDNMEEPGSWSGMSFLNFYRSFNKSFLTSAQKLDTLGQHKPVYVSSFQESKLQGGARLLLPIGVNDTVIPVYDDELTSIISYALISPEYHTQLEMETDKPKDSGDLVHSLPFSGSLIHPSDEITFESTRSSGSLEDSILSTSGSRSSLVLDPLSYTKALHTRVSFGDDSPLGKVRYSVTCYYAKRFEALRKICCPSEMDFIRSLSRCKKWGAQGGKSNVFFAKTLDDRFIIKQVTKTELESFIKFAPEYFKYLSESIGTGSPTCLAKILGIYQVTKHLKGGKESKMDVLVMENLLFRRNVKRLYDLKGSSRSRYNPDSSGKNNVLLDQNLIEAMPTSPIFVGNKAKRLLERAVWNDTSFLATIDVMDYSLLVGVDEEKHELVLGIIDFMRQYTWDKHLENWVKASGILGGPRNSSPTVISPKQYKKRFRKAMTTYFLMVPDQWSPPSIVPSRSQSDLCEENPQGGTAVE